ncbi:unnamed protein product [Schistocephalus solidus]|uniref:G_PROTEIN_RECEP_F1_2 domain-containing protein n=1 Tax=Schistocephalus solidus TaxID=70667 RepID=A0A183T6W8_SCHSO|nr:unnamed protein product [Schistocephalus solidus]
MFWPEDMLRVVKTAEQDSMTTHEETTGYQELEKATECSVFWDSYFQVQTVQACNFTSKADLGPVDRIRFWSPIPLSCLAAISNLLTFILLIRVLRILTRARNPESGQRIATGHVLLSLVSRWERRPKTMHVGLIVFCFFETICHVALSAGQGLHLYVWDRLACNPLPPPVNGTFAQALTILPVLGSLLNWLRDGGICSRNWTITVITLTRAEIVIWPLATRTYQRCLRRRRIFFGLLTLFILLSFLLSWFRRMDRELVVCYSELLQSYCTWDRPFLENLNFQTVYFSFQTIVPWLLILIATIVIVIHLKVVKDPLSRRNSRQAWSSARRTAFQRASYSVFLLALLFTICEFPTFAMFTYYIVGNPDADMFLWDTTALIFLQVDSLSNFFLLVLTMPTLRRLLHCNLCLFPCKLMPQRG